MVAFIRTVLLVPRVKGSVFRKRKLTISRPFVVPVGQVIARRIERLYWVIQPEFGKAGQRSILCLANTWIPVLA